MSKMTMESTHSGVSLFETRRKLRRVRMIVDVTTALIDGDQSLSYREACSLVDCAEKAIGELIPSYREKFELSIRPQFDEIIRQRWPLEHFPAHELVN
jgi:hypothetical protein